MPLDPFDDDETARTRVWFNDVDAPTAPLPVTVPGSASRLELAAFVVLTTAWIAVVVWLALS